MCIGYPKRNLDSSRVIVISKMDLARGWVINIVNWVYLVGISGFRKWYEWSCTEKKSVVLMFITLINGAVGTDG